MNEQSVNRPAAVIAVVGISFIAVAAFLVLSVWLVHSFGSGTDTGTHLVPIAVDHEGKRVPSIENQTRQLP